MNVPWQMLQRSREMRQIKSAVLNIYVRQSSLLVVLTAYARKKHRFWGGLPANRSRSDACRFSASLHLYRCSLMHKHIAHTHRMFNFIKRKLVRVSRKKNQTKCCNKNTTKLQIHVWPKSNCLCRTASMLTTHSKEMHCELVANFICTAWTKEVDGKKETLRGI